MYHKQALADGPFDRRARGSVHSQICGPVARPDRRGSLAVKPPYWDVAVETLGANDRVLKRLIQSYPGVHMTRRGDAFTTLARAIVGQQISVKAAQTIWERVAKAVAARGDPVHFDPRRVGRTRLATLQKCGLWPSVPRRHRRKSNPLSRKATHRSAKACSSSTRRARRSAVSSMR